MPGFGVRGINLKLSDLNPNPKNPRTISDAKLSMLKKSLDIFGDLSGVVYNRKTKCLVGGHQRSKIFDKNTDVTITKKYPKPSKVGTVSEGYFEVKGEKFSYREVYWDETKEKAANIAANKGAGEWDLPQLSEWLKDLNNFDLDFDMDLTMFDSEEIKDFAGITVSEHTRTGPTGVDEDEVPEKAPSKTKVGDLYLLGSHRLLCGDSTDSDCIEKLMNGEKADMVFTDPPYGINLNTSYADTLGAGRSFDRTIKNYKKVQGDDKDFDFTKSFEFVKHIKEQFWFGANNYHHQLPKGGSWIVWDKKTNENLQRMYGADFELCWSRIKHAQEIVRATWAGVCGHHKKDDGATKVHPTMKSIKCIEWFFERYKGAVLDTFGGSGSTLIACEKTNRKCFMMEIDEHYCDVIVERWQKYTGQKAALQNKVKTVRRGKKH